MNDTEINLIKNDVTVHVPEKALALSKLIPRTLQSKFNMKAAKAELEEFKCYLELNEEYIKICEKYNINQMVPTLKFRARLFQSALYEEDKSIQEMMAKLLANATMNIKFNKIRFVEMAEGLSKEDAALLKHFYDVLTTVNKEDLSNYIFFKQSIYQKFTVDPFDFEIILSNFCALEICSVPSMVDNVMVYNAKNDSKDYQPSEVFSVTPLGHAFLESSFVVHAEKIKES